MRETEQWHRRNAWIIAETVNRTWGGKGVTQYMDDWWPFGDKQVQVLITEKMTEMRQASKKGAIQLATNSLVQDAIKKHNLGRRSKNSNRS